MKRAAVCVREILGYAQASAADVAITTVVTNALLQSSDRPLGLIVTKGFRHNPQDPLTRQ